MSVSRSFISLFPKNFSPSLLYKSKTIVNVNFSLCFSTLVEKDKPLTVYEFLKNKHHFSHNVASRVASVITHLKNPQSSDSLLSFLKENGFSITQLEIIMKIRPTFLNASLEKTIKPKITLLQDMGFSADDIVNLITKNPNILGYSIKRILPSLSLLTGILGSKLEMAKVFRHSVRLFSADLETNLVPNIEFLKSCGIPMEEILKIIHLFPNIFLIKPENMRKYVNKADELGVDRSSKMFLYAVRVVSSMSNENLELKFKAFRDFGFSEEDILRVFRSAPIVFTVSTDKIRKIKEILLKTEKYSVSCIVKCPTILTCSVESRYKPRLQVLEILEKKNLIEKWPSLATLSKIPNKKFCEKFVDPFSNELQDVKLMIEPR